ncbi:MAG: hypothetical protein H6707_00155 [Deltaproteobacteria bacterium]|nr:hypothetical protein [Deltaproteobacteria bacterium]
MKRDTLRVKTASRISPQRSYVLAIFCLLLGCENNTEIALARRQQALSGRVEAIDALPAREANRYRAVVPLERALYGGTAVLLGPQVALTAGHAYADLGTARDLTVSDDPRQINTDLRIGEAYYHVKTLRRFYDGRADGPDLALLILEQPIDAASEMIFPRIAANQVSTGVRPVLVGAGVSAEQLRTRAKRTAAGWIPDNSIRPWTWGHSQGGGIVRRGLAQPISSIVGETFFTQYYDRFFQADDGVYVQLGLEASLERAATTCWGDSGGAVLASGCRAGQVKACATDGIQPAEAEQRHITAIRAVEDNPLGSSGDPCGWTFNNRRCALPTDLREHALSKNRFCERGLICDPDDLRCREPYVYPATPTEVVPAIDLPAIATPTASNCLSLDAQERPQLIGIIRGFFVGEHSPVVEPAQADQRDGDIGIRAPGSRDTFQLLSSRRVAQLRATVQAALGNDAATAIFDESAGGKGEGSFGDTPATEPAIGCQVAPHATSRIMSLLLALLLTLARRRR